MGILREASLSESEEAEMTCLVCTDRVQSRGHHVHPAHLAPSSSMAEVNNGMIMRLKFGVQVGEFLGHAFTALILIPKNWRAKYEATRHWTLPK